MKLVLTILLLLGVALAQADRSYEDHGQLATRPLHVRLISGAVIDRDGATIPGAQVLLFSNKHSLLQETQADAQGLFSIAKVSPGTYRLVIKYPPFCAANVPIQVTTSVRDKQSVVVTMLPRSRDECSYGSLK